MTTTAAIHDQLEQALDDHGHLLYAMALLVVGNRKRSMALLQATFVQAAADAVPQDMHGWLRILLAATPRLADSKAVEARRGRPDTGSASAEALFQAVQRLPVEQRQVIGLRLWLGYDDVQAAHIVALDPDAVATTLVAALQQLASDFDYAIPADEPTVDCAPARAELRRAFGAGRYSAATRGHLAMCSACRGFEQRWEELEHAVERSVRQALRDQQLDRAARAALLSAVHGRRNPLQRPAVRLALLAALVLLVIGGLTLPGQGVTPTARPATVAEEVDPRGLVAQSITGYALPPAGSEMGVWHAEWETLWYFSSGSLAPLRAAAWIDAGNPARHRLEFRHRDGGAPYEFQVGDGDDSLWYALNAAYYGSLYGGHDDRRRTRLVHRWYSAADQEQARAERMQSGVWDLGMAYLRQAATAADLRDLGQVSIDDHEARIIAFSGHSPLGYPAGAPEASALPVTILLTLDIADGRLRSVQELIGPAGSAQTSRTTWRLVQEEWQPNTAALFDGEQAWTGRGGFDRRPAEPAADPGLPLISERESVPLEVLLEDNAAPVWVPGTPPPGAERAVLRWSQAIWADEPEGRRLLAMKPASLTYIGPGRWLTLTFDETLVHKDAEVLQMGAWNVQLRAQRAGRYRVAIQRQTQTNTIWQTGQPAEPPGTMLIDARGYSRAELLQLVADLRPFDAQSLEAQAELFRRNGSRHTGFLFPLLQSFKSLSPSSSGL